MPTKEDRWTPAVGEDADESKTSKRMLAVDDDVDEARPVDAGRRREDDNEARPADTGR